LAWRQAAALFEEPSERDLLVALAEGADELGGGLYGDLAADLTVAVRRCFGRGGYRAAEDLE
jgi:hypothetical protein